MYLFPLLNGVSFSFTFFFQPVSRVLVFIVKLHKNLNQLEELIFLIYGKEEKNEKPAKTAFSYLHIFYPSTEAEIRGEKNLQSKIEQKYADPNTARANKSNRVSSLQS